MKQPDTQKHGKAAKDTPGYPERVLPGWAGAAGDVERESSLFEMKKGKDS